MKGSNNKMKVNAFFLKKKVKQDLKEIFQ